VLHHHVDDEHRILAALSACSAATVARINYRASSTHPYPTPCHDVLFAFDWLRHHLLCDGFDRAVLGRVGVCGQLVGGSLATMLALTECRVGETRVVAAAVNNPIVDWVFVDEIPPVTTEELPEPMAADETAFPADQDATSLAEPEPEPEPEPSHKRSSPVRKNALPTSWQAHGDNSVIPALTLSAERDMLFCRPDDYLDRFASPIHFFRSPHAQIPPPIPDDPDDLLDMEAKFALDHYASFQARTPATLSRCRAYARHYPQASMHVKLPVWHMATGLQSPLSDQTHELAKVVQRSIVRQRLKAQEGRTSWTDASEKQRYEEWAQEKVVLQKYQGTGLWSSQDGDPNWITRIEQVGTWMKRSLEPGFA